jgi:hypothetical protein
MRTCPNGRMIMAGILLTPDLTPMDFFLSDFIEDHIHATSLLNNLQELITQDS